MKNIDFFIFLKSRRQRGEWYSYICHYAVYKNPRIDFYFWSLSSLIQKKTCFLLNLDRTNKQLWLETQSWNHKEQFVATNIVCPRNSCYLLKKINWNPITFKNTWSLWMACWKVGTDDFFWCSELWDTEEEEEEVDTAETVEDLEKKRLWRMTGRGRKEKWVLWGLRIEVINGSARIAIVNKLVLLSGWGFSEPLDKRLRHLQIGTIYWNIFTRKKNKHAALTSCYYKIN